MPEMSTSQIFFEKFISSYNTGYKADEKAFRNVLYPILKHLAIGMVYT
jgi:hypothetical protein